MALKLIYHVFIYETFKPHSPPRTQNTSRWETSEFSGKIQIHIFESWCNSMKNGRKYIFLFISGKTDLGRFCTWKFIACETRLSACASILWENLNDICFSCLVFLFIGWFFSCFLILHGLQKSLVMFLLAFDCDIGSLRV